MRFCRSDGFYFTLVNTTNLLNVIYQPNKILIAPSMNAFFKIIIINKKGMQVAVQHSLNNEILHTVHLEDAD
jgi:hypothetical protein